MTREQQVSEYHAELTYDEDMSEMRTTGEDRLEPLMLD
jgi:hypothetical protein